MPLSTFRGDDIKVYLRYELGEQNENKNRCSREMSALEENLTFIIGGKVELPLTFEKTSPMRDTSRRKKTHVLEKCPEIKL